MIADKLIKVIIGSTSMFKWAIKLQIFKGKVGEIKDIMAKSTRLGMQTFDQALFFLYEDGTISYEEAMRNADSKNELRLRIKLESKRDTSIGDQPTESLKIMEEDSARTFWGTGIRV